MVEDEDEDEDDDDENNEGVSLSLSLELDINPGMVSARVERIGAIIRFLALGVDMRSSLVIAGVPFLEATQTHSSAPFSKHPRRRKEN